MKKGKKRILTGAAFIALLAAAATYCILLGVEADLMNDYAKGRVLVAGKEIAEGVVLTEENVREYIQEKEMDVKLIPGTAVVDWEALYQKITASPIDAGSVVTASMLEDLNEVWSSLRQPVLAGFTAEDLYQVVSGVLRSGDRIHIYVVDKETGLASLLWENIFIRDVFNSAGEQIDAENHAASAQRVNILMEKEDVERFYTELSNGSLRVVKALQAGSAR